MIASKISIEFNKLKNDISEAFIAVGMVTDEKFDFFRRNLSANVKIALITGVHLPTTPKVLKKLKEAESIRAKAYAKKFFHPKLYLFNTPDGWVAFVGSGNFTNGGWHENEELFVKIIDQPSCEKLKEKFENWFIEAIEITDKFIEVYSQTFNSNLPKQKETQSNISQLLDFLNHKFNIDNIDFNEQFFQKKHHQAFEPGKTHLETSDVLAERMEVRSRLYELNELLENLMPTEWQLYPHYENEHIVAHIENNFHHDYNVKALWLAYGRNKRTLKEYGEWATPLQFMRMQVIIRYDDIGIWLMPGKQGAGQIDREYFALRMTEPPYRERFFGLLKQLGDPFWIEIAGDTKPINFFDSPDALWEFTKSDKWRDYYFTIGRNYELGNMELNKYHLAQTVVANFKAFFPIYELIKDSSLKRGL